MLNREETHVMKIGLVNDFFPPKTTGGTELFLKALYTYLENQGFEIFLITQNAVSGGTGFKTYKINSSPLNFKHMKQAPGITLPWLAFNKPLISQIKQIYKKETPDILHINNLYHLSLAPLQAAEEIPFLLDAHDYWPVCFSKDLFKDDQKFCTQKENWRCSFCLSKKFSFPAEPFFIPQLYIESNMKRKLLSNAKEIVCHSNFVKERLEERGYKSRVIPYPYFGKENKNPIKNKRGEKLNLLFAGRVELKKGADLLIPLAQELLKQKIDFRIDVIGEGPLKTTVDRKDLNIHTHGFLVEEKYKFFERADFLVAPSRWPEPFGIVSLEAMEYRIPIITLESSGGLRDIVKENNIGIISSQATIAEDIINLYNNEKQIQLFKSNCKKIKQYRKEKIFKEYKKLLEHIVKNYGDKKSE